MTMTSWMPELVADRPGVTKRKALTDAIVADIERGALRVGDRLPPHRDLALHLGVSVQTVSLGYKDAERLGYLSSTVGRGTFVRGRVSDRADRFMLDRQPDELVDLSIVRAVYTETHEERFRATMAELSTADNAEWMRSCRPVAGLDRHRRIGARWLRSLGLEAEPDRMLVTNGVAHAIFLALASFVRPNDVILTESFTDHGVIGLANVLGFTLKGLPTDSEGILPDAFNQACRSTAVRALIVTPTFTNPTGHLASAERRRRIAEVARHHGVFVVEDEVFRPLVEDDLPAVSSFVPELAFHCTSFTKSVMTGLRTGYLVVPPQFAIRTASVLRLTSWSGVPLMAEIAARWIEDGTVADLLRVQRGVIQARWNRLSAVLGEHVDGGHPLALSAWIKVPSHWTEEALVRALRERRVALTASDPFQVEPAERPNRVRLSLGGSMSETTLASALETIRMTLGQYPAINDIGFAP